MKIFKALSLTLAFTLISSSVLAADIYDLKTETTLATGVIQKNIKRLTDAGWQNINIIEADLSDARYGVKTLTDTEDLTKLLNVKTLAQTHNTVAAVNGDFFSWKWDDKSRGSAVGGMFDDGNMLSSATSPWNFSTVAQADDGSFIFDYIDCAIAVAAPNGYITPIEHINKYDDLTTPIIYTSEWGPLSPGSQGTQSEIVIENDTIVSVNYDVGPVPFPENGYIIAFLRDQSPEIVENFFVGDKVELGINYEPKFENIQFAVGAGTLLLKNGEKAQNTNDIAGNHPRTAIGVNKDGSKLYLVTVDGRQTSSKGVSLSYMSSLMAEIGAYDAANLDGGGSTTMVVKSPFTREHQVVNNPSDKYLRPVINGVGIVPVKKADSDGFITIETDADYVFKGTSIYLNAKIHDSVGDIIDAVPQWSAKGGSIDNGYFTPDSLGEHTVTASYNGKKASKKIRVLENPAKLSTGLKEYKIGVGESAYISLTAQDEKGYKAYLNLSDADITLSSSSIKVEGNSIKGTKKGSFVVTFNMGDIQTSAIIRVGGDNSKTELSKDIVSDTSSDISDGFSMSLFGDTATKNTLIEKLVIKKYASVLESADTDIAVFAGSTVNLPEINKEVITTSDFSVKNYGDTTIITTDGTSSHWKKIIDAIKNTNCENLFIVSSKTINDDEAYNEEMLIDLTEKYLKNVNVYVISPDGEAFEADSGIKHIQIPGTESIKGALTAISDAYYYKVTVNGGKYSIEKIKIYE